jgi:hypothetical protein
VPATGGARAVPPASTSPRAAGPPAATTSPRARLSRQESNLSENSFQTPPQTPTLNFIPRQISESYQQLGGEAGSAASERKTSVRALQQAQYSQLGQPAPPGPNGAQQAAKPGPRTQNKSAR